VNARDRNPACTRHESRREDPGTLLPTPTAALGRPSCRLLQPPPRRPGPRDPRGRARAGVLRSPVLERA